jgi:uncharacterized protein (DUF885 family)
MHRFENVAVVDMDELIAPRGPGTLVEMLDRLDREHPQVWSIVADDVRQVTQWRIHTLYVHDGAQQ